MKLFKTSEQYLEYYFSNHKLNFRVQHWSKNPQPWCNYKSSEWNNYITEYKYVNHREILPDEIVFDIDCHGENLSETEQKIKTKKLGDILSQRLKDQGFDFAYWQSGGNGVHLHLFFPELLSYNKPHRQYIKKLFYKHIGQEYLQVPEGEAHICQGNPILIQLELAIHRKGGVKTLLDWNTTKANKIPTQILEDFESKKTEFNNKKLYNLNPDVPKAIQFLENEDFANVKDGRTRALFVLACYYSHFMTDKELFQKVKKWNEYQLHGYLNEKQILATIKSVTKQKERPLFPYRYLKNLLEELGLEADYSDITFK